MGKRADTKVLAGAEGTGVAGGSSPRFRTLQNSAS